MITSEINRRKGLSGVMEAEGTDGSVWEECFTWVGDTHSPTATSGKESFGPGSLRSCTAVME